MKIASRLNKWDRSNNSHLNFQFITNYGNDTRWWYHNDMLIHASIYFFKAQEPRIISIILFVPKLIAILQTGVETLKNKTHP